MMVYQLACHETSWIMCFKAHFWNEDETFVFVYVPILRWQKRTEKNSNNVQVFGKIFGFCFCFGSFSFCVFLFSLHNYLLAIVWELQKSNIAMTKRTNDLLHRWNQINFILKGTAKLYHNWTTKISIWMENTSYLRTAAGSYYGWMLKMSTWNAKMTKTLIINYHQSETHSSIYGRNQIKALNRAHTHTRKHSQFIHPPA